jgi:very-short-patch-repair endonuclease
VTERPPSDAQGRVVREAVAQWRDGLVNLSRSNRLLHFRPRRTSAVEIVGADSSAIVRGLVAGTVFAFRGAAVSLDKADPDTEDQPVTSGRGRARTGVLDTATGGKELSGALRNLLRRSHQEYLDRGLRILYLAIGSLEWTDDTGTAYSSPLLLVPVELESPGPRRLPHLRAAEDDAVMNPALALQLSESDVSLPTVGDLDELDPAQVLAQVRDAVAGRRGWRVLDGVVLSYFTFAKEAMYRDLLDNEDRIASHPAIVALAAGGRGEAVGNFGFDEIPDEDVDRLAPADGTPLVIDADSSQRACIAAAVEGRSFVMDGPPGTGKSQTIANMIGALLHAGRTVLFVSEKAAALDVVRNRLTDVGLGSYLLELHSSKATRKEVASELGRALDMRPVVPRGMSSVGVEQLRRRQRELNAYAAAMNEPREPLGESLHTVIGRAAELVETPAAPSTGHPVEGLTPALLGDIRRAASALSEVWRPALQGSSFLWREVREHRAMSARLQTAVRALDDVDEAITADRPAADAFGLAELADAERLASLLEHYADRPQRVPEHWVAGGSLEDIDRAVAQLQHELQELRGLQADVTAAAGVAWHDLPAVDGLAALDLRRLADVDPSPLPVDQLTVTRIDGLATRLRTDHTTLTEAREALATAAALLRLPPPRTFDDADRLLVVAGAAHDDERAEAAWFSARGRAAAGAALDHLVFVRRVLDEAEASARRFYDPSALDVDVVALDERFRIQHTGLRKLSGAYRKDKAVVAEFTLDGVAPADAQRNLPLVAAWQQALGAFQAAAPAHARDLGAYYRGRATDADQVARVLGRAARIADSCGEGDLTGVAQQLGRGALTAPALVHAERTAASALGRWRNALAQVSELGPRPVLLTGTIDAALIWIDVHRTVLSLCRDAVAGVDEATDRSWTVRDARGILERRGTVERALASFAARAAVHRAACGDLFDHTDTDLDALQSALEWMRRLQVLVGGPLAPSQAQTLAQSGNGATLRSAAARWRAARVDVVGAFAPSRHAELADDLAGVDDARALLSALLDDSSGQDEWMAYQEYRHELTRHGLGEAIAFCVREQLPATVVPDVIEKAVLTEWIDHHLGTDPALRGSARAQTQDAAIAEFRDLDRQVIAGAVGSIIDACNARRPRTITPQAGVIRREAEKKRKHMPVRDLLQRSRDVTQAIKPCFMMSPLAVSQYLSSDLMFDVVIFDEASQVAPMDAINCIYRGRSLITAGDPKQLPPTAFFAAGNDDGDEWVDDADDAKDFESILDLAKSSGAFRNLTLRWHYRSRHESLIAFSNASFYEGRLITFPGAEHEGPDVGVELIPVQGVYRRGSSRDNPVEAQVVAQRVLHHYDTRPTRSVGVVTFSEAQATAIEAALEQARKERPDLDEHFTEDRLDGFFVKNLESVQGDERDVMIFSIGYGPDENGKTTMTFGPLNKSGGWRRLNVAITRARYRNEIVSSLGAGDITASTTNEGVRHLRRYLDFAERGPATLALDTSTGGDAESPFEESVIRTIRSWGYDVTPQVGTAGYRIDMAVHHPDQPGVFVLGVECDGAQYHSSRVARDRDRLRDQVLVGLGWRMHRIWGTAWYRDRPGTERRLIEAIEKAVRAPVRGVFGGAEEPPAFGRVAVDVEPAEFAAVPDWAVPYGVASIGQRPRWTEPHDPAIRPAMREAIEAIVRTESPVHVDVVHQRFRQGWNIGQIGSRIRANVDAAARMADVRREGNWLHAIGEETVTVRTPVDECRRTVDQIHPSELQAALFQLVRDAGGVGPDELSVSASRLFGWNRRGHDITGRLDAMLRHLVKAGRLVRAGNDELRLAGD